MREVKDHLKDASSRQLARTWREVRSHFKEPYEEDMSRISLTPEEINDTKPFRIRQVVANTPVSEADG